MRHNPPVSKEMTSRVVRCEFAELCFGSEPPLCDASRCLHDRLFISEHPGRSDRHNFSDFLIKQLRDYKPADFAVAYLAFFTISRISFRAETVRSYRQKSARQFIPPPG